MAIFKCKMCGGDMEISADKTFGTCEYCGSTMTLPKGMEDEQRAAAFNRGNHFRRACDFDKALAVYERIVAENDADAEAHWCCALCRFGIEYVEDPVSYEYIPTCHRASFDSFLEDVDYLAAVEHSDGLTRRQYQKDAAKIAEVQRGILATSQTTDPFDVFICYKESDENGQRTRDSIMAQDIYYQLTEEGYRVFFSRITLEDVVGTQYEPYIFAALNSAKVMVTVGIKPEHFNAVWVKNEWSRFLAMMKKDRSKLLLPCYKDMDPYDLPEQLSVLQSYDMSKIGFVQDLIRGIKKVIDNGKTNTASAHTETVVVQQSAVAPADDAMVKRGMQALEDEDWAQAESFFERALDQNPECSDAFMGKVLSKNKLQTILRLEQSMIDLSGDKDFARALLYASPEQRQQLEQVKKQAAENLKKHKQAEEEQRAEIERHREEIKLGLFKARQRIVLPQKHVAAGTYHTVGLKSDGTVVAVGDNSYARCNIFGWRAIVDVAAGGWHTAGLKLDGTVVAVGDNSHAQCNISGWRAIVDVAAGDWHTVGLKSDGMVLAVGKNDEDQCMVSDWTDIVSVTAGKWHTVGLKSDGTVVAVGKNDEGQCMVSGWTDIVAVVAGDNHTVGLKSDGTVLAVGKNDEGQRMVSDWTDIVAVAAGGNHTVGLKSDGMVLAVGENEDGRCDVSGWRDVVAVAAGGNHTVGLKSDGTVLAVGKNECGPCDVSDWKLFNSIDALKCELVEARRIEAERAPRRAAGLCQHCGGELKGLFSKKCVTCGKPKDY